jgi:short-subunit dehydrogenase involved in D-alanine esterification of teichoic acids
MFSTRATSNPYLPLSPRLRKSTHPEVDCLINNAAVQRLFQALGPDYDFDLSKADQEIDTNIREPLHLSLAFLPYLNAQLNDGVLMNVSSVLGYLPSSVIKPVYTYLRRERKDPDVNKRSKGAKTSLTIQEFMDNGVVTGWKANDDAPYSCCGFWKSPGAKVLRSLRG